MEPKRLLAVPPGREAPAGAHRTATRDRPRVLSVAARPAEPPGLEGLRPAADLAVGGGPALGEMGFDLEALLGGKRENDQPVSVDPERAAAAPFAEFHRAIVMDCLDRASMLGRHRRVRPLRARARNEERLLAQVDALAVAGMTAGEAASFVESEVEDDPWAVWGPLFALGCFAGPGALAGAYTLIQSLPEEAPEAGIVAAWALRAAPHPEMEALARDLLDAEEPVARAVGVDVLAARGWLAPARAAELLRHPHALVRAAALRAQVELAPRDRRAPAPAPIPWEAMRAALRAEEIDVAWSAARALTLLGDPTPCAELRSGGLAQRLGLSSLEVFVLGGVPEDGERVLSIARGLPMTAGLLDAVARFGHPAARPLLLHGLAQPELAEDAAEALATLFGAVVTGEAALDPKAWVAATAGIDPGRMVRLRRGAPWSSAIAAGECGSLALSADAAALRIDEITARTGARPAVDLEVFWPELRPAIEAMG